MTQRGFLLGLGEGGT